MLEHKSDQRIETDIQEHPAVKAWEEIEPKFVRPNYIEVLTHKNKGSVYRIADVGPQQTAVIAKRCKFEKAWIERIIYEEVFPSLTVPTPNFYGYTKEKDGIFWWSPTIAEHRALAARWMGEMNSSTNIMELSSHLPNRGPEYYRRYISVVFEMVPLIQINYSLEENYRHTFTSILTMCEHLEKHWDRIENFSSNAPRTIVHGDCQVKNVHIRSTRTGLTFLPFDWASAGWGLPATDLGQLSLPYRSLPPTNPDCETYLSYVQHNWSDATLEAVQQLANLGKIFWSLKVISKSLPEFNDKQTHFEGLLYNYRVYESVLNSTLHNSHWIS
jgi:thiamine kinase-like enzyme